MSRDLCTVVGDTDHSGQLGQQLVRKSIMSGKHQQYTIDSLVAPMIKNLPAMQETWIRSLGWKDPLEKEKATHCSILA